MRIALAEAQSFEQGTLASVVNSGDHEGNLKIPLPSNPSHPATESLICPIDGLNVSKCM